MAKELIGLEIQGYKIEFKLDQGSFGTVYQAVNTKTLERAVIKFTQDED